MSTITMECDPQVASLQKKMEVLHKENEHLRTALANIQSNLAQSVAYNQANVEFCDQNAGLFSDMATQFELLRNDSRSICNEIGESRSRVQQTDGQLHTVGEVATLIQEIANQTNLLALNATIEAARAGESGKGFAVVAAEVKSLSSQTQEAAEKITTAVVEIRESSSRVVEGMQQLDHGSAKITETVDSFNQMIEASQEGNQETRQRITAASDQVFMCLAKLDHVLWKVNTYLSVLESEQVFKFVDSHNCRLGKWYEEGEGRQSFSGVASYESLKQPHAAVHDATRQVFDLLGAPENATAIAEALAEMERASDVVFQSLDKMLAEKRQG